MNLPTSFIDYTRALLGNEEYEKLAAALQQEPPVSIRINKLRMKEEGLSSLTDSSAHFSFNKVPWASDGYYLDERLTLRSTRCFMPVATMFRRLRPCLWSRCCGSMSSLRW